MHLRDFRRAGHWPYLVCAFFYFDVSFMVWVLLGALAILHRRPSSDYRDSEKGLLVAPFRCWVARCSDWSSAS